MEENQISAEQSADRIYTHAADLIINQNMDAASVKSDLMQRGLSAADATLVVDNLQNQIEEAKKEKARKDMLYGALWCIGGIVATAANIGFIFWGAILFGGIQFIRGAINSR